MSEAMTSPFCDLNPSYSPLPGGVFDFHGAVGGVDHGTLGFMDLLGLQDVSASLFDAVPIPIRSPLPAGLRESSEKVNLPATPNSSTMSSSSTEEANEADSVIPARDDDVGELDREKKRGSDSKEGMKKGQKRQREPRFAFVTKSEVDNLEDGFRWRKYGQKAVKNSPYPRSYYRCTSALCGVKKRVERSSDDATLVVTTYEGKHTHPSPLLPRGTHHRFTHPSFPGTVSASFAPLGINDLHPLELQTPLPVRYPSHLLSPQPSDFQHKISITLPLPPAGTAFDSCDERIRCKTSPGGGLRDHGLLQDLIPSELMKNEQ